MTRYGFIPSTEASNASAWERVDWHCVSNDRTGEGKREASYTALSKVAAVAANIYLKKRVFMKTKIQ